MLKYIVPVLFISTAAIAQAAAPPDPALNACQILLGNSNAQTIQTAVQVQSLAKQLEEAKAELTKLKQPPDAQKP